MSWTNKAKEGERRTRLAKTFCSSLAMYTLSSVSQEHAQPVLGQRER